MIACAMMLIALFASTSSAQDSFQCDRTHADYGSPRLNRQHGQCNIWMSEVYASYDQSVSGIRHAEPTIGITDNAPTGVGTYDYKCDNDDGSATTTNGSVCMCHVQRWRTDDAYSIADKPVPYSSAGGLPFIKGTIPYLSCGTPDRTWGRNYDAVPLTVLGE